MDTLEALQQVGHWPVDHAAAAVVADGHLWRSGDTGRVFDLASVTKPIAAWGFLVAVEEGVVELDQPMGPEGATVRHLLAHASGVGFRDREPERLVGERRIYSSAGFEILAEGVEKLIELDDRILAACAEQVDFAEAGVEKRLPEADLIVLAVQRDERLRAIADTALGGVDDATEVDGIVGVFQNAQVSDDVADLFAFVELRAADHFVGDAGAHEDIL